MTASLPLERGQRGEAVRTSSAGCRGRLTPAPADWGCSARDRGRVSAFQQARGLARRRHLRPRPGGAGRGRLELGDRTLYLRVAQPPRRRRRRAPAALGRLGFDAGRVDGIFGPHTAAALVDFQRNAELTPPTACAGRHRASAPPPGPADRPGPAVRGPRARARCARPAHAARPRASSSASSAASPRWPARVRPGAARAGRACSSLDDPDAPGQAAAANGFQADVYLGLTAADGAATHRLLRHRRVRVARWSPPGRAAPRRAGAGPHRCRRRPARDAAPGPAGDADARGAVRARADPRPSSTRARPSPRAVGRALARGWRRRSSLDRHCPGRGFVHRVVPSCADPELGRLFGHSKSFGSLSVISR